MLSGNFLVWVLLIAASLVIEPCLSSSHLGRNMVLINPPVIQKEIFKVGGQIKTVASANDYTVTQVTSEHLGLEGLGKQFYDCVSGTQKHLNEHAMSEYVLDKITDVVGDLVKDLAKDELKGLVGKFAVGGTTPVDVNGLLAEPGVTGHIDGDTAEVLTQVADAGIAKLREKASQVTLEGIQETLLEKLLNKIPLYADIKSIVEMSAKRLSAAPMSCALCSAEMLHRLESRNQPVSAVDSASLYNAVTATWHFKIYGACAAWDKGPDCGYSKRSICDVPPRSYYGKDEKLHKGGSRYEGCLDPEDERKPEELLVNMKYDELRLMLGDPSSSSNQRPPSIEEMVEKLRCKSYKDTPLQLLQEIQRRSERQSLTYVKSLAGLEVLGCVVPDDMAPPVYGMLDGACKPGNRVPNGKTCAASCDENFDLVGERPSCHAGVFNVGSLQCKLRPAEEGLSLFKKIGRFLSTPTGNDAGDWQDGLPEDVHNLEVDLASLWGE